MINHEFDAPLNSAYGQGAFRRRILLRREAQSVTAELEDDYHAFRLRLEHDGNRITGIHAQSLRIPTVACLEAPALLAGLVGQPLTGNRLAFRGGSSPRLHCTHLHDLLWLAMAQAFRESTCRLYDIQVPDLVNGRSRACVQLDGTELLTWETDMDRLLKPAEHADKPLRSGFSRWAAEHYRGDQLEAAYILQIAIMVAHARRFDVDAMRATRNQPGDELLGACHAFQPNVIKRAHPMMNTVRDFSERPDDLLRFLD
ncbi:DUF2889 domain-containing protein [Pseudomonas sp. CG7]|uniref:DUF2889 domain-containing protein n=1 Tax=Pseudomonas sp. CG7 TaxID=191007 RepID=UPI002034A450|nr:DUF2889 domain-containing protein [Pseudomonas sp. CG7]MCM2459344.1 DUF2889 domain-containing protein [Pseudomonas sp. CG7]